MALWFCRLFKDLQILLMHSRYFVFISPLEMGVAPQLNNLETQRCVVPSLVEIDPAILEKKIFSISSVYFRYFLIIFPWKRVDPSFEQTWIPFTKGCFVLIWLKLAKWFWGRRWKWGKIYDDNTNSKQWRRRRTTDILWSEKLTWAFGSCDLKYGNNVIHIFDTPMSTYTSTCNICTIFMNRYIGFICFVVYSLTFCSLTSCFIDFIRHLCDILFQMSNYCN